MTRMMTSPTASIDARFVHCVHNWFGHHGYGRVVTPVSCVLLCVGNTMCQFLKQMPIILHFRVHVCIQTLSDSVWPCLSLYATNKPELYQLASSRFSSARYSSFQRCERRVRVPWHGWIHHRSVSLNFRSVLRTFCNISSSNPRASATSGSIRPVCLLRQTTVINEASDLSFAGNMDIWTVTQANSAWPPFLARWSHMSTGTSVVFVGNECECCQRKSSVGVSHPEEWTLDKNSTCRTYPRIL